MILQLLLNSQQLLTTTLISTGLAVFFQHSFDDVASILDFLRDCFHLAQGINLVEGEFSFESCSVVSDCPCFLFSEAESVWQNTQWNGLNHVYNFSKYQHDYQKNYRSVFLIDFEYVIRNCLLNSLQHNLVHAHNLGSSFSQSKEVNEWSWQRQQGSLELGQDCKGSKISFIGLRSAIRGLFMSCVYVFQVIIDCCCGVWSRQAVSRWCC